MHQVVTLQNRTSFEKFLEVPISRFHFSRRQVIFNKNRENMLGSMRLNRFLISIFVLE